MIKVHYVILLIMIGLISFTCASSTGSPKTLVPSEQGPKTTSVKPGGYINPLSSKIEEWKKKYPDLFKEYPKLEGLLKNREADKAIDLLSQSRFAGTAAEIIIYLFPDSHHIDSLHYWNIVQILKSKVSKEALQEIIKLLSDSDQRVRETAFGIISNLQAKEAIPDLIKLLSNSDRDIVTSSIYTLENLLGKEAIPHIKGLLSAPDNDISVHCALTLARLGDKSGLTKIIDVVNKNNNVIPDWWIHSFINMVSPIVYGKLYKSKITEEIILKNDTLRNTLIEICQKAKINLRIDDPINEFTKVGGQEEEPNTFIFGSPSEEMRWVGKIKKGANLINTIETIIGNKNLFIIEKDSIVITGWEKAQQWWYKWLMDNK